MLVRNLQKPGDYKRAVLVQDENLRLAIANDANIAAARKNADAGVIPEVTEQQQRTRAEQQIESSSAKLVAMNHLREIFSESQVQKLMSVITSDNEIEFINVYWDDIKKELQTKDTARMTVPYFVKVLKSVMKWNTGAAGLSVESAPASQSVSLNETEELRQVIPDASVLYDIGVRLQKEKNEEANAYFAISVALPTKPILKKIDEASPAIRQQVIGQLMEQFRGLNPRTAYWEAILNIPLNRAFVRTAVDAIPTINLLPILNAYSLVDEEYSNAVRQDIRQLFQMSPRRPRRPALPPSPEPATRTSARVVPEDMPRPRPAPVRSRTQMDRAISQAEAGLPSPQPARRYGRGVKSGKGIAVQPKVYHDLGKYLIDGSELDKQVLSIKYQSGSAVPDFPRKVALSDNLHELIKDLIETQKLNKSMLKQLDPIERRAIETILVKSGVGIGLGIKEVTPTDEDKIKQDRLNLLMGSFNAGNNNKDLIHELRSLVLYFLNTGRLSKKEALNTLQTLV